MSESINIHAVRLLSRFGVIAMTNEEVDGVATLKHQTTAGWAMGNKQ